MRIRVVSLMMTGLFALAGCSDQACFQWNEAEGACPDRQKAGEFLREAECSSVKSDGEFADGTCCYDVERSDAQPSGDGFCVDYYE